MKKLPLADTGLLVSQLGLGTVKFGRDVGVKYPGDFKLPTDQEAVDLMNVARELGINLIDTAPAYGISERRVGALLADQRDEWVLSTKVGEEFIGEVSSHDFSAEHAQRSLERSLNVLLTSWLDIVLIHSDGNDVAILEAGGVLDVLLDWKAQGIIKAVGMSTKTAAGGCEAFQRGCDLVMATYTPWHTDEAAVLDEAARLGKAVFIKKAFGSGHFGGSTSSADPVRESLQFIFDHPGATSVITGTLNAEHLRQNAAALTL